MATEMDLFDSFFILSLLALRLGKFMEQIESSPHGYDSVVLFLRRCFQRAFRIQIGWHGVCGMDQV